MYPDFIKEAEAEGNNIAKRVFHFANEAEKVHAELYQKALEALENKEDVDYYLCPVCGYIHERTAPEKCPICGAKQSAFKNLG